MTENIQQKIDQITAKVTAMQQKMSVQVEKNKNLESEIETLKAALQAQKEQLQEKDSELIALSNKMSVTAEQSAPSSVDSKHNREQEIDDLVKEIEYCISQLKK